MIIKLILGILNMDFGLRIMKFGKVSIIMWLMWLILAIKIMNFGGLNIFGNIKIICYQYIPLTLWGGYIYDSSRGRGWVQP